jgi:radical SAM superfamily enzyme YgiQ (UPF0313 family)
MRKLKILLCDPRHSTIGSHVTSIPIGIGYIASYIKKKIKNIKVDIILEVDPDKIISNIKTFNPDIVASSNYVWNSQISNFICSEAKKNNSNTLCLLGGPEFPAGTGARKIENNYKDETYDKCFEFMMNRPFVDYFSYTDGEVSMIEIINKFIESDFLVIEMKKKDVPIRGWVNISKDKKKLLIGEYIPRIGLDGSVKASGRDEIPSPYTTGLLDKFLDGTLIPAFETARGCPFLCTFCDQGLDMSKITAFSVNRLMEEFWYVGKKMSQIEDGTKTVDIFDSNWGIFDKDVELADKILEVMNEYDWPQYIQCLTPKSNRENLLKINDKLKNRVQVGLSMQSINPITLTDIKRKNWTIKQYLEYVEEIRKRGKNVSSELIIPLPGETKETFFEGVNFLLDNNVSPNVYTLMMLCGAELGRDLAIKKNNMKSKYRILPKSFGKYKEKIVVETERICVGTNAMSFQDYLECRNYSFILRLISHQSFLPIYKIAKEFDIGWYELSKKLTELIQKEEFEGKLKDIFNEFCKESLNELFDSEKEAIDFYSEERNYKLLKSGDIGDNLIGKYTAKALLEINEIVPIIFKLMNSEFNIKENENFKKVSLASEKWLTNIFMIDKIFNENFNHETKYNLKIDFDLPSWLAKEKQPVINFFKDSHYELSYDKNKLKYLRNELRILSASTKEIALGKLLMQQTGRDFSSFEKQYSKIN